MIRGRIKTSITAAAVGLIAVILANAKWQPASPAPRLAGSW